MQAGNIKITPLKLKWIFPDKEISIATFKGNRKNAIAVKTKGKTTPKSPALIIFFIKSHIIKIICKRGDFN